jgi:hypothetical protein
MPLPKDWDAMTDRIWKAYSIFGKVNGVGWTKIGKNNTFDPKGKDGIDVNFETLLPDTKKSEIPTQFEGWPVRWEVIGVIRPQGDL